MVADQRPPFTRIALNSTAAVQGKLNIFFASNTSGVVEFAAELEDPESIGAFDFVPHSPQHTVSMGPCFQPGQSYMATLTKSESLVISMHDSSSGKITQVITAFRNNDTGPQTLLQRYGSFLMIGVMLVVNVFVKKYMRKAMGNRGPSHEAAMKAVNNAVSGTTANVGIGSGSGEGKKHK